MQRLTQVLSKSDIIESNFRLYQMERRLGEEVDQNTAVTANESLLYKSCDAISEQHQNLRFQLVVQRWSSQSNL